MNRRISRRAFIAGVATSAVVAAIAVMSPRAGAQQTGALRRVGVLLALLSPDGKEAQAFRQGLAQAGYSEGRDLVIEWRSSQGDYALLPQLAAQLVQRKVDVIVADTTRAVQAAKEITSSVPIVMTLAADPVGSDLVTTLRHPGGNITGLSILLAELSTKRLQLLREAMPQLVRVAVLSNSASPYHRKAVEELRAVAPTMSLELSFLDVLAPEQIESVFAALGAARAQAVYVLDSPLFFNRRATLVELASKKGLPLISGEKPFAYSGALLTYGADYVDQMRRAAPYVDRILKGANPGDLPVEQPIKLELVVNLKTARALGVTIPESVLLRADEMIQ